MRQQRLRRWARLTAVLPVALVGALAAFAVPAAAATVPTTITVSVEPPTVLEPYTPATFRAAVVPSDARGVVTFTFDGAVLGTAAVVGGQAVFESASHPVGSHQLQAAFEPAAGSGFALSVSSPVDVTVQAIARLALARAGGAPVPPGSQVRVGERLTVSALGFPPFSTVSFTLASRSLPLTITTNASGNGSARLRLAGDLPSAVYLLSAAGGKRSAGFVFYIYNPPEAPVAAPTPTNAAPIVVVPVTSNSSQPPPGSAAVPVPTDGPRLAQTGSAAALLVPSGVLLLGLGVGLRGLAPRRGGRHAHPRQRNCGRSVQTRGGAR